MRLFDAQLYIDRRTRLCEEVQSGIIWIMGNGESACNYKDNTYPFRQNSNFLYYFGINAPDLNALLDCETGEAVIYGHELTMDDIIWMGEIDKLSNLARKVGVTKIKEPAALQTDIAKAKSKGISVHFTPPYRLEHHEAVHQAGLDYPSLSLIEAIFNQRSIKSDLELQEMAKAVNITGEMHVAAMQFSKAGKYEYEVVAEITRICKAHNADFSYGPIFSIDGQVLHNHHHANLMKDGRLVLNDSGAQTDMLYAGDITRTFPVSGRFTDQQKEIYQIVLEMEKKGIMSCKPGVYYRDVHLAVCKLMIERFKELGILNGDPDAMLEQGVYGLFMPHGLGHMIGLDVHDMEDLGENHIGYEAGQERSKLLGLKSLRLARKLQAGFTLTVEPGIYFIPQLIEKYKAAHLFSDFVNYNKLEAYYDFGGIRVEDNIVVTQEGCDVIGDYIPKEMEEIESIMQ